MPSTAPSLGERITLRDFERARTDRPRDRWLCVIDEAQSISPRTVFGQTLDADWRPVVTAAHEAAWHAMWRGIGSLHQSAVECRLPCTPTWANLEVETVIHEFQVERTRNQIAAWAVQGPPTFVEQVDDAIEMRFRSYANEIHPIQGTFPVE